ncbi:NIPSNAP family protein [Pelagibacterium lacus]|uniref:NIPSNAP family protein n=1 Tax=Pelagibacterium lacus TaxID=2282655 RepID=UPI0011C03E11|nr:NIPSNAP family protein [Pelagibacterium lacus]
MALLPNRLGDVLPILPETYARYAPNGTALGCFACEFGVLNRFILLAAYENAEALQADRARDLEADDPFGIQKHLGAVVRNAYKPLFFMPPIAPGDFGPFYEFRTYSIAPGGLPETAEAWSKIVERRQQMSKLLMVMGSIGDAPTKMVHIWPYKTIEDRMKARGQASKEGIWPPPGGSAQLTNLQSELFVATGYSDLK